MREWMHNSALRWLEGCLGFVLLAASAQGQQPAASQEQIAAPEKNATNVPPGSTQGTVIDSVVAVVNGDVILESDVDEERRFEIIQPYRGSAAEFSRDRAVQRLIDRTLIQQQAALEP